MKRLASVVLALVTAHAALATESGTPAPTYRLIELGNLSGGAGWSGPSDLNSLDQVVGESSLANGQPRAFLWSSSTGTVNLGTLPGGNGSGAKAINDVGQVVGGSFQGLTTGTTHAFLWDASNGMTDLGVPSGYENSELIAINNFGQAVGVATAGTRRVAVYWDAANGWRELDSLLPGLDLANTAVAINSAGQIAGTSDAATGPRATLWNTDGTIVDLGDLPGGADHSSAADINDLGQVAGSSFVSGNTRAFLWDSVGGLQDLGDLPGGYDYSSASGLNNAGQVVGSSGAESGASGHGFLWDSGNLYDLNDLILPEDPLAPYVSITAGVDINEAGRIIALGVDSRAGAVSRAYLLMPISPVNELLDALVRSATGIGPGTSFADKAVLVRTYYEEADVVTACGYLQGFLNQVRALSGTKHLDQNAADQLTEDVMVLIGRLACDE